MIHNRKQKITSKDNSNKNKSKLKKEISKRSSTNKHKSNNNSNNEQRESFELSINMKRFSTEEHIMIIVGSISAAFLLYMEGVRLYYICYCLFCFGWLYLLGDRNKYVSMIASISPAILIFNNVPLSSPTFLGCFSIHGAIVFIAGS